MSIRRQIIQIVSEAAPVGAALGDEWVQPSTNRLYKRVINDSIPTWVEIIKPDSAGNVGIGIAAKYRLDVGGDVGINGNYLINPNLKSYTEHKVTNDATTGTVTLDLSTSNVFQSTLTGNTTFVFVSPPVNTKVFSFTIITVQDATGGRTITWPASKKFSGGLAPPATTTANAVDIWSVMTYDGGASYIISLSVKDAK